MIRLRHWVVAAALAGFGCAVMVVDVDVYKGPLANHREVQVQQLAALAVGAKPVLIRLRNELEGNDHLEPTGRQGVNYQFKDSDARRVNEILGLYEDLPLAKESAEFTTALERITRAWQVFLHDGRTVAERLTALPSGPQTDRIRAAYRAFLMPPGRGGWREDRGLRRLLWPGDEKAWEERYAALKLFGELARTDGPLAAHGRSLFSDEAEAREFIASVNRIATAFLTLYTNLHVVLRQTLAMIVSLGADPLAKRDEEVRALGKIVLDTMDSRLVAAVLLASLESPSALPEAMRPHRDTLASLAVSRVEPLRDLARRPAESPANPGHSSTGFRHAESKLRELLLPALLEQLVAHPARMAEALLAADEWVAGGEEWKASDRIGNWGLDGSFTQPAKRRHGIGRGPSRDGFGISNRDEYEAAIERARALLRSVTSLSRGRLPQGLQTLIEAFLQETHNARGGPEVVDLVSYEQLSNELIRFAQKLLFIANSDTMFAPPSEGLRWLFQQAGRRLNPLPGSGAEGSVRVLQSIGWSILVQTDELRQWRDHRDRQRDAKTAETEAVRKANQLIPSLAMQGLLDEGELQVAKAVKRLRTAEADQADAVAQLAKLMGDLPALRQARADLARAASAELAAEVVSERLGDTAALADLLADGLVVDALDLSRSGSVADFLDRLHAALALGPRTDAARRGLQAHRSSPALAGRASGAGRGHYDALVGEVGARRDALGKVVKQDRILAEALDSEARITRQIADLAPQIARYRAAVQDAEATLTCLRTVSDEVVAALAAGDSSVTKVLLRRTSEARDEARKGFDEASEKAKAAAEAWEELVRPHAEAAARLRDRLREARLADSDLSTVPRLLARAAALRVTLADASIAGTAADFDTLERRLAVAVENAPAETRQQRADALAAWAPLRARVQALAAAAPADWLAAVRGLVADEVRGLELVQQQEAETRRGAVALEQATRAAGGADAEKQRLHAEHQRHAATVETIEKMRDKVGFASFTTPTADEFRNVVLAVVERQRGDLPGRDGARRLAESFRGLGPLDESLLKGARDAKGVLDVLIAELHQRHIAAVARHGPDSAPARQIAQALSAAYEHRTGMIYIRPPSAYLRTSYPSSSLQADPALGWTNMLAEQGWRSIPGYGSLWNPLLGLHNDRFASVNAEIDKQFWQSINRVRVAGAGNTNYVVAKDDIGNWYVKAYAADSGPITKSAINLGLYSMGPRFGVDLIGAAAKPGQRATAPSDLETARVRFEAYYGAQIDGRAVPLRLLFDAEKGAPAKLRKAVGEDEPLKPIREAGAEFLDRAREHLKKLAGGESPGATAGERGRAMILAVRELRGYAQAVDKAIDATSGVTNADKLHQAVEELVRRPARTELAELSRLIQGYENELLILSGTTAAEANKGERP